MLLSSKWNKIFFWFLCPKIYYFFPQIYFPRTLVNPNHIPLCAWSYSWVSQNSLMCLLNFYNLKNFSWASCNLQTSCWYLVLRKICILSLVFWFFFNINHFFLLLKLLLAREALFFSFLLWCYYQSTQGFFSTVQSFVNCWYIMQFA